MPWCDLSHVSAIGAKPLPSTIQRWLPYLTIGKRIPWCLASRLINICQRDGAPPLGRAKDWNYKTSEGEFQIGNEYDAPGMGWIKLVISSDNMDQKMISTFWIRAKSRYIGSGEVELYMEIRTCDRDTYYTFGFGPKFLVDLGSSLAWMNLSKKMINQELIQGRSKLVIE